MILGSLIDFNTKKELLKIEHPFSVGCHSNFFQRIDNQIDQMISKEIKNKKMLKEAIYVLKD